MKNILLITLFLLCNIGKAQKLSDYKYVYVPENIKDFESNKYDLNSTLVKALQSKGYTVIQNEQSEWPQDLRQSPCEVANINILDTGNFFKNRLTFEAKDCHEKVFLSQQGVSSEKDFEMGFKESLQKSLVNIPNSAPVKKLAEVSDNKITVEQSAEKEQPSKMSESKIPDEVDTKTSNNYSNGNIILQKVLIGNGQFILVNQNSAVPYATFSKSTKEDVYRVVLENGSMTLGYLENGSYVIEIPKQEGGFKRDVFKKK